MRYAVFRRTGLLLVGLAIIPWGCTGGTDTSDHTRKHYLPFQYSMFNDDAGYYLQSLSVARAHLISTSPVVQQSSPQIRWGIVSHHLLIRDSIAEFFLRLSSVVHPTTIILLGPNHFSRGEHRFAISRLQWKTPFGMILPDIDVVDELTRRGLANVDEDAFYNEHSVRALVPYVKYCFPGSKIVTIIVRSDADTVEANRLAHFLATEPGDKVLLLASLDFSHYRRSEEAQREDEVTFDILRRFDTAHYRNAFVDSHAIFLTVLSSCRELGATDIDILLHTNSGMIAGDPGIPCTSYMNLFISERPR